LGTHDYDLTYTQTNRDTLISTHNVPGDGSFLIPIYWAEDKRSALLRPLIIHPEISGDITNFYFYFSKKNIVLL